MLRRNCKCYFLPRPKLNQVLAKVRPSNDFINPILRLGKNASNYAELLKRSTIDRLSVNHRLVRQHRDKRDAALQAERTTLLGALEETANSYESVSMEAIASVQEQEFKIFEQFPETESILSDEYQSRIVEDFRELAVYARQHVRLTPLLCRKGSLPSQLLIVHRIATALSGITFSSVDLAKIISFTSEKLRVLCGLIDEIEDVRVPIFGFLMAGKKLNRISRRLRDECGIESNRPHTDLLQLKKLRANLQEIQDHLIQANLESHYTMGVAAVLAGITEPDSQFTVPARIHEAILRLDEAINTSCPLFASEKDDFYTALYHGRFNSLDQISAFKLQETKLRQLFEGIPEIDYFGTKTKIESLNTEILADRIDQQFLDYCDTKKADAFILGKIIRGKKKFPIDKFDDMQKAFPCI
jgi:hypothetical protein